MHYYTKEDAVKSCKHDIKCLRDSAQKIRLIKEIVRAFDGRVYNCRFDEAIQALNDDEAYFYCTNNYGWYHIIYSPRRDPWSKELLSVPAAVRGGSDKGKPEEKVFTDTKRIIADKMIELLNNKYADLLREANELENALTKIDEVLLQTKQLKQLYNVLVDTLPYSVQEKFNIQKCWR